MKLHNAPQNEAVLSNVGAVSSFTIKATAKSFRILSDGLYSNKINSIIRELSCNAVDSHVAAGKADVPFDVHLPSTLEPYFSIRDYGIGLDHHQVTTIFTTFFESTKTDSNDYVGALGLGSKSPFSYTENFTVTAIKDGRKGIYTAFINDHGVPSIALMIDEQTTDPAGVEIRFAVENKWDYDKFRREAQEVYTHFKLRPVVTGNSDFKFIDPEYYEKDVMPGVHFLFNGVKSYAVMGNIKYPINVPNSEQNLGELRHMLEYGIVMEFNIGELDFQASREGLSYIPQTIAAIKSKLQQLSDHLEVYVAKKADAISGLWEKAAYLEDIKYARSNHSNRLLRDAAIKYVSKHPNPFLKMNDPAAGSSAGFHRPGIKLEVSELKQKFNITLKRFDRSSDYTSCTSIELRDGHLYIGGKSYTVFVINDTNTGAVSRAKAHFKTKQGSRIVWVIEPANRKLPVDVDGFFKRIHNPPANMIMLASSLGGQGVARNYASNVTILRLEDAARRSWGSKPTKVWRDAGKANTFDSTETYYYVLLAGYESKGKVGNVKHLEELLQKSGIHTGYIYGVRKADHEWVKTQPNWKELDQMVVARLTKALQAVSMGLVKNKINWNDLYGSNEFSDGDFLQPNCPYYDLYLTFNRVESVEFEKARSFTSLAKLYDLKDVTSVEALFQKYVAEINAVKARYPLLHFLSRTPRKAALVEYINLVDASKNVQNS